MKYLHTIWNGMKAVAKFIGHFIGWIATMILLGWVRAFLVHDLGLTNLFFVSL